MQVLVLKVVDENDLTKNKIVWRYIEREECNCGYLYLFCSCKHWIRLKSKEEKTIKLEKMTHNNLIGHLINQKKFGIKLSKKDEQLLNENQYKTSMASNNKFILAPHD